MAQLPATVEALPRSLIDVAETVGLRIAIRLMEAYGGMEVKFPVRPPDSHHVVEALGREDATALCNFLSGCRIYVPHGRGAKSIRAEVLALQEAGRSRAEIARILRVSQRHVRRMANKADNTDQMTLF